MSWGNSYAGGDSSHVQAELKQGVYTFYSTERAFAAKMQDGSVVSWGDAYFGGDSSRVIDALRKHSGHLPINKIRPLVCHPECIPEDSDHVMFCMTYKNERVVVMSWKANTIHRRNGIVSAPDTVARGN